MRMTLKEIKVGEELNYRFLDRIDFTPYFEFCVTVAEVCQEIIAHNPIPISELPPELQGNYFNFLGEDDITQYLQKRYGDKWNFTEHVEIEYYITRKSKS